MSNVRQRLLKLVLCLGLTGLCAIWAQPAAAADPVLVGAGDIADCLSIGDEAAANLLDGIGGAVFTSSDNAYPNGAAADYSILQ